MLGWPELLSGPAGAFWRDNVSISYANNFNINTASVELLAVLLDIDMDEAGEIVAARVFLDHFDRLPVPAIHTSSHSKRHAQRGFC